MNPDLLPFWLIANTISLGMIALTWYAHCRFPGRLDRFGAITRCAGWLLLALLCTLSVGLV